MTSILIVEDDKMYRHLLRKTLCNSFACWEAVNMAQARVMLAKVPAYDAILLDVGLPDVMRDEVVKEVKDSSPSSAVVVLSGYEHPEEIRRGILDSASEWLIKGRDDQSPEALASKIRTAISHNRSYRLLSKAIEGEKG